MATVFGYGLSNQFGMTAAGVRVGWQDDYFTRGRLRTKHQGFYVNMGEHLEHV